MVIKRTFNGGLNFDDAKSVLPPGDYTDAYNITMDTDGGNQDNLINSVVGNRKVNFTLPAGVNKVISGDAGIDNTKNRLIFFIWNSLGFHTIAEFDKDTRTTTKIFQSRTDSSGVDILNLQVQYKVNHINIIHRGEDGDLLLWTDAYNRPGQLNIDDFKAGLYGTTVTDDLIRLARMPSLDEVLPVYQDDLTQPVNNLKKKLFQFAYAWGYKGGEISTISPVSKTILPTNAYSGETESDPGKNNVISLQLLAGGVDYQFIRLFGRQSLATTWGDWFVIDTLDRDDYAIPPGGTYNYKFLNDRQYVDADQAYMSLLFDYVADKCNAQELVNGNVVVQAGITDGYDPIKRSDINVQIGSFLVDTASPTGPSPTNPTVTVNIDPGFVDYNIGASVGEGDFYVLKLTWDYHRLGFPAVTGANLSVQYVATSADTANSVANALIGLFNAQIAAKYPNSSASASHRDGVLNRVTVDVVFNTQPPYNVVGTATAPVFRLGASATWKWSAKYRLGLVYVDKYGKSNGVISFVSTEDDPNDFSVTTPSFDTNQDTSSPLLGNPKVPVITASINHTPPEWAVAYYWVRTTNQTTDRFLQYITSEVQQDAGYYYFCIENLGVYKAENTGFVPSYSFTSGDRVKIYASIFPSSVPFTLPLLTPVDYEIIGTVERAMNITSGAATQGLFLKIKKTSPPIAFFPLTFVEIYTPATHVTDNTQLFFGFGESYAINIDSVTGIHYHAGQTQDQTADQPALFQFADGDVYYKFREFYQLNLSTGKIDPATIYERGVMDVNYSDYWPSAVNSNGAAWIIDSNAKKLYSPTQIRFGQAYEDGTNINGLNRFYFEDQDIYDRSFGDIQRLHVRDRLLRVYQKLKVGAVPVLTQILKDAAGGDVVAVSDKLLNPIRYYEGDYGIGDNPESLASNNYADYFVSNIRGVICRLSQDGLTPISILYKANSFGVNEVGIRSFDAKMYGSFDEHQNKYILALEATGSSPAQTISFNEIKNRFDSKLNYTPEAICCLNQLIIAFKEGDLWTHDSTTYNNFFGIQYPSSITGVFNDGPDQKKAFTAISIVSKNQWIIPSITTSLGQSSELSKATDFRQKEGVWYGAFLRDSNSPKGVAGGDPLKGRWIEIKMETLDGSVPNDLFIVETKFITSNLNNQ